MPILESTLETIDVDDEILAAKCRALIRGYHAKWKDSGWIALQIEQEFRVPIVNIESGEQHEFDYGGKRDLIVCHRDDMNSLFLKDHKTTSQDLKAGSQYLQSLRLNTQARIYSLSAWQQEMKLDGCLWDLIRKPKLVPRKLTKKDCAEITGGTYFGTAVSRDTLDSVVCSDPIKSENAELYEIRLTHEIMLDLDAYYRREPIPILDDDLAEFAGELWQMADTVSRARQTNSWYKNPDSCFDYNKPCDFMALCTGYEIVEQWRSKQNTHSELSIGDKEMLTNSSLACFRSCPRKYYYAYELGLESKKTDEALVFGTLLHKALEVWWSGISKEEVYSQWQQSRLSQSRTG